MPVSTATPSESNRWCGRWRNWAVDEKDGKALTGDALLAFVNNELFPTLKKLPVNENTPRGKAIVRMVFEDLNQYMKDGIILRKLINIIDEVDFDDNDDRHTFGDIYEGILKDLQSAGNAGEFYTPRALTDFIVQQLHPKLGETFGDFTSGTGGFLTSCLNYLKPNAFKSADSEKKFQSTIVGQEWKPLPYLLSITNMLLHGIEEPNITHTDSLGRKVTEFKDSDKVDCIGMNPPYGGSTGMNAKLNFPMNMQSSETADLFIVLIMYRLKKMGRAGPMGSCSVPTAQNLPSSRSCSANSTCTPSFACRAASLAPTPASRRTSCSLTTKRRRAHRQDSAPRKPGSTALTCPKATSTSARRSPCAWNTASP